MKPDRSTNFSDDTGAPPPQTGPFAVWAAGCVAIACLGVLLWFPPEQLRPPPPWTLFLGRFHLVAAHFPIALLAVSLLFEVLRAIGPRRFSAQFPRESANLLLALGAVSAAVAAMLGWMLACSGGYEPLLLKRHLVSGTLTATLAVLALVVKLRADQRLRGGATMRLFHVLLFLSCAAMALASHLGGSLTHGSGYLTEHAPGVLRRLLGLPVGGAKQAAAGQRAERKVFPDVVLPILTDRCTSCHGAEKQKGKLRLDSVPVVLKGGENGPVVVAGQPAKSDLLHRLSLPPDDDDRMPPPGKPQPTDGEIRILAWWVEAGLPDEVPLAALNVPQAVRDAIAAREGKPAR